MKKYSICRNDSCDSNLYAGGLCKTHYEEDESKRERREAALKALHYRKVGDTFPSDPELRAELFRLCKRWDLVCQVIQSGNSRKNIDVNEAEYATE